MNSDINKLVDGNTQLMLAAAKGNTSEVEALLTQGADPHVVDGFGNTAAVRAERNGHLDVMARLQQAMKDIEPLEQQPQPVKPKYEEPKLYDFLYFLAVVVFIAGAIICAIVWPEESHRYEPTKANYLGAMLWLIAGFMQFIIFICIAEVLSYLKQIAFNTKRT